MLAPMTGGGVPMPVFVLTVAVAAWGAARVAARVGNLRAARGEVVEAIDPVVSAVDLAERQQTEKALRDSLREKDLLLKEIHHRVKNNLQVIVSLLGIQSAHIRDPRDLEVFTESQNRIHLMALVHEQLYQSKDLAHIDFRSYLSSLVEDVLASYRTRSARVSVAVEIEEVFLDINAAIPCGLIVNELVSNCLKHAFPDSGSGRGSGRINVNLRRMNEAEYALSVSDNGVGFPPDCNFRELPTLGLQLVVSLAAQLQGTIELHNEGGAEFRVVFPAAAAVEELRGERVRDAESEDSDRRGRDHRRAGHQAAA